MAGKPNNGLKRRRVEVFCGTSIGRAEIARIGTVIESKPGLTRLELAREVCRRFEWRRPSGRFPERACVDLLVRLEQRGEISLPAPQRSGASYRKPLPKLPPDFLLGPTPGIEEWLKPSAELLVRPIAPEERFGWEAYVERFHYLGCRQLVGESLRYVATLDGELVALLGWGAATLKIAARDGYIGWDARAKKRNLGFVVNNARFLILPWIRMPNLASRVLSRNLKRLSSDWKVAYGHPVWLAETFVDLSRFRGTCYRAANWRYIGDTKGYARTGGGSSYTYSRHGKKKAIFLYPLHRRVRELLCASATKNKPGGIMIDVEVLDLDGDNGLLPVLRSCTDPRMRRGIRHPLESVLAIAACAVLAGARSYDAIAQWAKDQSEETLRRLKCRRGKPPSEPTIRRVLKRVDSEEVDRKLGAWLVKQQSLEGQAIAIDGKTLRGSRDGEEAGVHLLSAVVHSTGVIIAQTQVPGKTNEITRVEPLFEGLDIAGTVVTADALLTQKEIARHLTEDKKADYVFTVKDNQPTLRKDIEDLFEFDRQEAERLHRAKGLDNEAFPPDHKTVDKGHGRLEIRQIWVSDELQNYLEFPGNQQVFRIERTTTYLSTNRTTHEVCYGITSLETERATAADVLSYNRGHWGIENRVHWVRDVTFDEDRSQVRKGNGPQTMASLRNLAIGLLPLCRVSNIAAALRHLGRRAEKVLCLIGA